MKTPMRQNWEFSYSVERGGRSVALLAMMFAYDFYHSGAILKAEGTRKWMVIDDGYLLLGSNAYKGKNDCIIMTMVNGRHYDSSFLVTYSENWALGNNTFFRYQQNITTYVTRIGLFSIYSLHRKLAQSLSIIMNCQNKNTLL